MKGTKKTYIFKLTAGVSIQIKVITPDLIKQVKKSTIIIINKQFYFKIWSIYLKVYDILKNKKIQRIIEIQYIIIIKTL